jgi:hypothetical protein
MREVYEARNSRLDRTVEIKILPESLAADPHFHGSIGTSSAWHAGASSRRTSD